MIKQNTIIDTIKDINNNLKDFKSTQPASGKSFVNYSVSSNNSYDFSVISTVMDKAIKITYTHSEPKKYNIVDLSYFFRIDNNAVMDNPYLSNASPYTVEMCCEKPQLGKTTWILDCSNLDFTTYPNVHSHTFYFKFYFNGTVDGTFSAQLM